MNYDQPLVGVTTLVLRDRKVLLHKRKGKHAPGMWAGPGGHLELFEDIKVAALRELAEEVGPDMVITEPAFWTVSNTKFYDEGKHYVVIIMVANWVSGEAVVMEPDKCECWGWYDWDSLPEPLMPGLQDLKNHNLDPRIYCE